MKKCNILFFLFACSLSSFSQYDFKRGFIVVEDDTIHGFIDYTTPNTNSNYCFFKRDSLDEILKYTPHEIDAYGIDSSKLFVRKTVTIDDKQETVFLEYLVDGVVDLYYCRRLNTNFYFIEKEGTIYSLSNKEVAITVNSQEMIKESKEYVGILAWLMSDAKEIRSEIYSTELNHNSLIKLSKDYHNTVCDDEECIVYFKKQKSTNDAKWRLSVGIIAEYIMAGMNLDVSMNSSSNLYTMSFLNPNTGNYEQQEKWIELSHITKTNAQFNSFISGFSPGLYLNINQNSRFSFQVQFKYQFMKNSRMEVQKIQVPFLMSYDFLRYTKAIPYMIMGFGNDFYTGFKAIKPLYANYDHLTDVIYDYDNAQIIPVYSQRVVKYDEKIILSKKYYPVMMVGMGLSYDLPNQKKVRFEITGSYNYIESNNNTSIYHSELQFAFFAFSLKYEL